MTAIRTYIVEHDLGFAPNPFWGACTLAACKPLIRKAAAQGDVIIGTTAARHGRGRLTYWMRVEEILSFDEYWHDDRFRRKKPHLAGSKIQRYGDNIYYKGNEGSYVQVDSFHSKEGGICAEDNYQNDLGTTDKVLISKEFTYWGRLAPIIPDELGEFVLPGVGQKWNFSPQQVADFLGWLSVLGPQGVQGFPADW
ncbi:hypothetical protein [Hansschlegelia beijingensis]|uniref:Nucleotide modification associated domain-containing protein n=1 Tax=Hansschlegelia beijingensis TaxID=1133344 RepID=A0A7W6CYM5_9HYPH|nr:hypothetical protein [Hansschlegelia beijingensis]